MSSNRIVSSTIIRPAVETEDDKRTQRRKRAFPDAPEPARHPQSRSRSRSRSPLASSRDNTRRRSNQGQGQDVERQGGGGGGGGVGGVVEGGAGGGERRVRESLESASAAFRRRSSGPGHTSSSSSTYSNINDRLGDTHIHPSSASTTTTTITTADALDSEAKRLRTANATEDDTRRGKRMMGMILGTLTQFKRQARTVVPRVAVPPVNSVNATAVDEKTEVVESKSGPRVSSTATATVSTAVTEATEIVTTTTTTAAVSRRDVDTRAERDVDSRGASDSDSRGVRDIDSRGAKDVSSRSVRDSDSRRDGDSRYARDSDSRKDGVSRRGRDGGNARIPSAPALDVRRLSEPELDIAPPTAPAADLGRASREAVQERVREKLRMEKEANDDRLRKERADREARLRETLLKQIAGRSSVPGRRRTAVGAPAAATTGPSSSTPPVHLSRRSRDARYENGYLMTETKPRLRYMPKVMNEATREKFNRQVEDNSDQRAIPKRGAPPPPRREDADMSSPKSRTPTVPAVVATATAVGRVDCHMQEDRYEEEDGEPSAEAVAKAEAEAERELDAGMDLGLDGSANDDFRRREVPMDSTREEAQNSEASGSSSVTVSGSPATVRDGGEDVAMEG